MLQSYLIAGRVEAGCDEAGRGCLAGPVTAAAVILPDDFHNDLINDSKQLTEHQREQLRPVIGKPTGNDLREGKVTLPLIYALRRDDMPERDEMLALVNKDCPSSEDIDRLIDFAKRAGGIDYAYATMNRLRDEANDVLSPYSPHETVDLLREIFDYVIERKL